ncbi:3-methyl-2-oxobutanoate hydroxymethyltransferase [bacterium]|nr:3-methyl-2-oxobutanoate hydroxymethyltransferase [bacterium]
MNKKNITIPVLKRMKQNGDKISMLTAYDFLFAQLMDECDIEMLLVGDSLGMVFQGEDSTLPVTMEDIIYHTRAVKRAVKHAMVVADMPFMSYQVTPEEAVRNAGRLMKEGGADAVKLECTGDTKTIIEKIVNAGIPVMGHVGLGPQSCKQLGGHTVQGKTPKAIMKIWRDAFDVEKAGAFSVVVEAVPWPVAKRITEVLHIPTIGIGAGPHCDGQVLVYADMVGLFTAFQPHFVRRFGQLGEEAKKAFINYKKSVKNGSFPTLDESYSIDNKVLEGLNAIRSDSSEYDERNTSH